MRLHRLTVDLIEGPDESGRFRVFGFGTIERWSLEQIKAHALAGNEVVLRVKSTVTAR